MKGRSFGLQLSKMAKCFRFRELSSPGRFSATAIGPNCTHKASGTRILPRYWSLVDYKADGCSESKTVTCEVLEHKANHRTVF